VIIAGIMVMAAVLSGNAALGFIIKSI